MNSFSYLHIKHPIGRIIQAEINADYQKKHNIEYELDWCPKQLWIGVPDLIAAEKLRPFLRSQNYNKINVFNSPVEGEDCIMIRGEYKTNPYAIINQDASKRLYNLYNAMGLNVQYACASSALAYAEIELTMENVAALQLILEKDRNNMLSIRYNKGHYDTIELHCLKSDKPEISIEETKALCFHLMQAREKASC